MDAKHKAHQLMLTNGGVPHPKAPFWEVRFTLTFFIELQGRLEPGPSRSE